MGKWTLIWDALVLAGAGAATYGCWLVWPPLAFIVGGAALAGVGLFGSWRQVTMGTRDAAD